jgi:hypothetical protein
MTTKYTDLKTKKDKIAFIRDKLLLDGRWAVRGLLKIYDYQTASEQNIGATTDHNNVGFSGVDSEILSSFAEQLKNGRTLSENKMKYVHKYMPKYARQLQRIADGEQ